MRQIYLPSAPASFLIACMCVATIPGAAFGQVARPGAVEQVQNVFLPAPRGLRQHLTRAEKALAEKQYGEAVLELGSLLTATQGEDGEAYGQDYFVGDVEGGKPLSSLKAQALQLLGNMPDKGRELFELQYGTDARTLLEDAIARGDIERLNEVTRRYFHTKAGYEAALLLGRYHLDQGRPLAAALSFQRVADTRSVVNDFEPELSVMLASSWLYSDMPEKAKATLLSLRQRQPKASVRVGRQQVALFQGDEQALTWLSNLIGLQQRLGGLEQVQWTMFRGNPQRNGVSRGSSPLLNFRWRVPTVNNPADEKMVDQRAQEYVNKDLAALPVLSPLAVNDVILMRTPSRLVAVDFASGKRVWEFPWLGSNGEQASDRMRLQGGSSSPRMNELNQRLWEDAPYGQVASDGHSVFLLNDLGYANTGNYMSPFLVVPGGQRQPNPNWPKIHNELVALDLEKEGKLRWIVGSSDGRDEPQLANAFFLGPPLPLMSRLYVMAEIKGEIRLVVLDSRTGRLLWSQQLAHVDERTITLNGERRLAGATPSFADGVLVCPTSAGAVVALSVANRSLLWGYAYQQSNAPTHRFGFSRANVSNPKQVGQRWADATATVADGRVIITPVESDTISCLDILTGDLKWKQDRDDGLFVACVKDGIVVLVGKSSVRALRIEDGQPAWEQPLKLAEQMPSGRGFVSDNQYFLPTIKSKLLKINLSDGTLAAEVRTDHPLGNLVCYRDEIISQGTDWLATFFQSEPLRERVADQLKQNPDNAWALARQGEIWLQDGNRQQALEAFRRAFQLQPDDDATRGLLVKTLLTAMQEDFRGNRAAASEVETLIDQPEQRAEYLRLMASGLQQVGDVEEAFEAYLKLAERPGHASGDLNSSEPLMDEIDGRLRVRRDRWIQARLAELWISASPEQRQRMDQTIHHRFDEAVQNGAPEDLRGFLRYFADHELATEARLLLATRLIELEELLEAELLLSTASESPDPGVQGRALALHVRLLLAAELPDEATSQLRELRDRFIDVVCLDGKTGAQIYDEAATNTELTERLAARRDWLVGKVESEDGGRQLNRYTSYPRVYPVQLEDKVGPFSEGIMMSYDQRRNTLEIQDDQGHSLREVPLGDGRRFYVSNYNVNKCRTNGHLLLAAIGQEVLAIDLLDSSENSPEAILWRRDLSQTIPRPYSATQVRTQGQTTPWGDSRYTAIDAAGNPLGIIGSAYSGGICFVRMRELVCADPLTGETIWSRNGIPVGAELFGDDRHVFIVPPKSEEATVYSLIDGQELGRRPVAPGDRRWRTVGSNELSWIQEGSTLRLRLRDAWEQREIWSRDFPLGSRGWLVGQDEVAVLQPDGKFVVLSLLDDKPRLEADVQPETSLSSIHVFPSRERYVLVVNTPSAASSGINASTIPLGTHVPLVSGKVYAFDRSTGLALWQAPAMIDRYGLPLDQPTEVPVLTFLRHVTQTANTPGGRSGTRGSVLCLDKRDGRILLQDDDIPAQIYNYQIVADVAKQVVQLMLPGKTFTLRFTDQPAPPIEPAAAKANPNDPARSLSEAGKALSGFAGVLFNALKPGAGKPVAGEKPAQPDDAAKPAVPADAVAPKDEKPAAPDKPAGEAPQDEKPASPEKPAGEAP